MSETALVIQDTTDGSLIPMAMGDTFRAYRTLQSEIDRSMPDQIMTIQGRQFRKKGYWRAVRAAFNLRVECVSEERIEKDGDWGYAVLYRATAKNGMSADGDGICMASEKAERQRTLHNVRSHGHTRAFNRAVSNLVGFGEVSAEEVERDEPHHAPAPVIEVRTTPAPKPAANLPEEPEHFWDDDDTPESAPAATVTYVSQVREVKTGTNANGPWTLWQVTFADKRKGGTFNNDLAAKAKAAIASHSQVIPTLEVGKSGMNLINLVVV